MAAPGGPCDRAAVLERLDDLAWYVATVHPGREFDALALLEARGVFAWTPTVTVWRRANRAGGKRLRTFPAAPGYAVLGLDPAFPRWASVFGCRLVSGVLGPDGRPERLARRGAVHPVEALLGACWVSPDAERHMRSREEFSVGDRVRVMEGPYEGALSAVDAIEGEAARIVLTVLGAARDVRVRLGALAKAA